MVREVCDIFLFNGEMDMLDLRLNILDPVVDRFIIKEANQTFQGEPKEVISKKIDNPKVFTYEVQFTTGMSTWDRDRFQRGTIIDLRAYGIEDDAIIMTSDLDEVPNPDAVAWLKNNFNPNLIYAFKQKMHQYYLNVVNLGEKWAGTRACSLEKYNTINAEIQRHRMDMCTTIEDAGWHWSFLGGKDLVERKIRSYAHEEYDNEQTISQIEHRMEKLEDVFHRGFQLVAIPLDQNYPQYILENQEKLAHLIKAL